MNFSDTLRVAFDRGYSTRKFPGGERRMYHRWPAHKMRNIDGKLLDLVAENVTRTNPLFERLTRK